MKMMAATYPFLPDNAYPRYVENTAKRPCKSESGDVKRMSRIDAPAQTKYGSIADTSCTYTSALHLQMGYQRPVSGGQLKNERLQDFRQSPAGAKAERSRPHRIIHISQQHDRRQVVQRPAHAREDVQHARDVHFAGPHDVLLDGERDGPVVQEQR